MIEIINEYFPVWGLPAASIVCLAASALCGLLLLLLLLRRLRAVRGRVKADDEAPLPVEGYPSVSVIVYSQGDSHNLGRLLVQILEQDYPAEMEVIVVNDENADATEDVVSAMQIRYSNLYMTFAPERSRNLSRKKLAVTLGMKAARYDVVALTCGNCSIDSPIWLRLMTRHFIDGKDVVVGNSLPGIMADGDNEDTLTPQTARMPRTDTFDIEWNALRRFGPSLTGGRVFMGDGFNMAYRRSLFFENKGFYRTLNLTYGDDDLFINEIATAENSTVELSPDARVIALEANPAHVYSVYRLRRVFTARMLPRRPYLFMSLLSWLSWLFVALAACAVALSLPFLTVAAAVVVLLPLVTVPSMMAWRKTGRALGIVRPSMLMQPLLMLWHPFYSLGYRLRSYRMRSDNYTWGRKL